MGVKWKAEPLSHSINQTVYFTKVNQILWPISVKNSWADATNDQENTQKLTFISHEVENFLYNLRITPD